MAKKMKQMKATPVPLSAEPPVPVKKQIKKVAAAPPTQAAKAVTKVTKKVSKTSSSNVEKKPKKKVVAAVDVPTQSTATAAPEEMPCLTYKLNERYSTLRHLFFKADASNENSLLISNIPPAINEDIIRGFVSQFVKVKINHVIPQRTTAADGDMSKGQRTFAVYFASSSGVTAALSGCRSVGPYTAADYGPLNTNSVFQNMVSSYCARLVPADELEAEVEEYMQNHDQRIIQERAEAKRRSKLPDEEGWVTVTKAGGKAAFKRPKIDKKNPLMPVEKKGKPKVDVAFYAFQLRESKEKAINTLREKFEEDKKRIAAAKAARKFKPY